MSEHAIEYVKTLSLERGDVVVLHVGREQRVSLGTLAAMGRELKLITEPAGAKALVLAEGLEVATIPAAAIPALESLIARERDEVYLSRGDEQALEELLEALKRDETTNDHDRPF